jgi:hypothetical protein
VINEKKMGSWVKGVAAAAFLGATAAAGIALAGGRPAAASPAASPAAEHSVSRWVPPGMHEANASADIGPGSDEAQAAGSPSAE